MCGICGIVSVDPSEPIDPSLIVRMRDRLTHRGPDDAGLYVTPGVALGHRRLSIIDLSPDGRQPMGNEDGNVQIVFNGEIYNFQSLADLLICRGHHLRSKTDTETIVHLYEEFGVDCLAHLRGMFAFAIWDERKRSLFLARDRLGKKPLFYSFDGRRLIFASEPKSIVVAMERPPEPDPQAISRYLSLGYVPGSLCALSGVSKLAPAHYLTFSNGRIAVKRYWQLSYVPKLKISRRDACDEIMRRMREAVALRMISDVPLGVFLSGGIDSSAVVATMSALSSHPVKTFSIGFKEPEYDETRYAQIVAKKFETDHHEFIVEPQPPEELLSTLAWHYDEPYADSSAIATYYLCKMTREHVTVALNGDAGDENFAGYPRYSVSLLASYLEGTPKLLRHAMGSAIAGGYALFAPSRRLANRLRLLSQILGEEWRAGYDRMLCYFTEPEKRAMFNNEFAMAAALSSSETPLASIYDDARADNPLDVTLSVDVNSYLPDDLLVKVDRASMAVSLEARSPLVDHEFMEFAARLPASYKMTLFGNKLIFKKALGGVLPPEILRRRKMGFGVPLDYWFRGEWTDLLHDVLLGSGAQTRTYFDPLFIRGIIEEHASGTRDRQFQLWALIMLEYWLRTFVARSGSQVSTDREAALSPPPF